MRNVKLWWKLHAVDTTDMFELSKIVLQGSVFGPIKCAVQMDTKLRLSQGKCFKIHICKNSIDFTQVLKVHELNMKTVSQSTYLGDDISEKGTVNETIEQRSKKAFESSHKYFQYCQVSH